MLLLRPFETQAHDGISRADVRAAAQQQAREGFPGAVLVVQGGHVLLDHGIGAIGGELMRRTSRLWLASLGWFSGHSKRGSVRVFSRGSEDAGPNALLYFYPATDTAIIVLTHAGNKHDVTSWSRAMHGALEAALGL